MELTVNNIIKVLLHKIWILIIATVVGALILGAYTVLFVDKQYTTTAKLYVRIDKDKGTSIYSDSTLARNIVATYLEMLKSSDILDPVSESLSDSYENISPKAIKNWFSGASLNGTEVFEIKITTNDPQLSYDVMKAIVNIAPERMQKYLEASGVEVIEQSEYPTAYSWPVARNTVLGALLGLMISAAICVLVAFLDTYVYTREDLSERFHIPVIGVIPKMKEHEEIDRIHGRRTLMQRLLGKYPNTDLRDSESERKMIINKSTPFSVTEAYRSARTNILYLPTYNSSCCKYAFTSSFAMEGKTTTAINTAITMAQNGKKVLIIDADMRKPRIGKNLGIKAESGLSEFLARLTETVTISRSNIENFYVLTSGKATSNASELLASDRMRQLLSQLEGEFDYIFIDTPPMNLVTDASVISELVDGYFMVAFSGYSDKNAVAEALEALAQVKANVRGFILNGVDPKNSYGKYGKYGNKYAYGKNGKYGYRYSSYDANESFIQIIDKDE